MSISTRVLPIEQISHLSIEQCLSDIASSSHLPLSLLLDDNSLTHNDAQAPLSKIELVVFSDLLVEQLLSLQSLSHITINALTAVNYRNQQTSYRFSVTCLDFIKARNALAKQALACHFEAALLENIPSLNEPGLLVMDMDSTTIQIECIDEIAKLAGTGELVSEVTERAMQGELDFAQSLHQRVATLEGSSEQILVDVAKNIPLMPGLENLICELKKHNWRIAIASGGFTYFAEYLKELLALDAIFANQLEIVNGQLTGKVLGSVVDAQAKADSLAILSERYQISKSQTVAMGDGANDLVMMSAAAFGVAFHAKPIVVAQADTSIHQQGLDCLLHWLS